LRIAPERDTPPYAQPNRIEFDEHSEGCCILQSVCIHTHLSGTLSTDANVVQECPRLSRGKMRYFAFFAVFAGVAFRSIVTGSERFSQFLTSVDFIEGETGLDFLAGLEDHLEDQIEAGKAGNVWRPVR